MKKRKFKKIYRKRMKKPILKNRFFWIAILVLIFLALLSYFLFFSETFQIRKIIITGEKKVAKKDIKILIEKNLEKKILFYKTKSIFLVNVSRIREEVLKNFVQIAEVEIKRGFPNTLNIVVIERLAVAVWCQEENCFLLDNEGVIFEENTSEGTLVKISDKENQNMFSLGEQVIEKGYLENILKIQRRRGEINIEIKEFAILNERLNVETSGGWLVFFNPEGNIEWQLTKLKAVLEEEIPSERRNDLEYIDLRFGNFAPYKYRD